jgi:hypothetical protein
LPLVFVHGVNSPRTPQVPPIKHPLALGAAASRFWVPQQNGARKVGAEIMIAHDPLHGSGQAALPHPGRVERRRCIERQRGVAVTGSSSEHAGASFRASVSFLRPPVSSRTVGFPQSGWGQQLSPESLSMMASLVKRWLAFLDYHQVCSKARRARLRRLAPATVCRLVCVARPPLPRALCSGGVTLHPRYYGPMRESCGLHAPSTLVS